MLSKECHFWHRPAPCWYNIFSFITSLFKLNPILLPHHRICRISIVSLHHFPSSLICTGDQASSPRRISNNLSFPQLSEVELHSWHFPMQPWQPPTLVWLQNRYYLLDLRGAGRGKSFTRQDFFSPVHISLRLGCAWNMRRIRTEGKTARHS